MKILIEWSSMVTKKRKRVPPLSSPEDKKDQEKKISLSGGLVSQISISITVTNHLKQ